MLFLLLSWRLFLQLFSVIYICSNLICLLSYVNWSFYFCCIFLLLFVLIFLFCSTINISVYLLCFNVCVRFQRFLLLFSSHFENHTFINKWNVCIGWLIFQFHFFYFAKGGCFFSLLQMFFVLYFCAVLMMMIFMEV